MRAYDIILSKRENKVLSFEEIDFMVQSNVSGEVPDYQMAAFLMAIFLNGMNKEETVHLVKAMIQSGDSINLDQIEGLKVDKHSTGGVGDKTSIVVAPLVASLGVKMPKISGRGLGHTGGTIDKLESIPGFSVDMTEEGFIQNVNEIGLAIGGQTKNLVPADKKLYALRDVTATVDNISLISASIMSKKLVSGADAIILDVKTGSGSFVPEQDKAFELAKCMIDIGTNMGKNTIAVVSNMEEPLGNTVGNSLELIEAIETLNGGGPEDFKSLCLELSSEILLLAEKAVNKEEAMQMCASALVEGSAMEKFKHFIAAQGGDVSFIDDISKLALAPLAHTYCANHSGYIHAMKAREIGLASLVLGAGREKKGDAIDHGAGLRIHKKVGDYVERGEPIISLYSSRLEQLASSIGYLNQAVEIKEAQCKKSPLLHGVLKAEAIH